MIGLSVWRARPLSAWTAFLVLTVAAGAATAAPEVVASRGLPSSLSARYGRVVPLSGSGSAGLLIAPTRAGIEIRDGADPALPLVGSLRLPGRVVAAVAAGDWGYVFTGEHGIAAVDLSDPARPRVGGAIGGLGAVSRGAVAPGANVLVAASDSALHLVALDGAGGMALRATKRHEDGRSIRALAARGDSVLVASVRFSPVLRTIATMLRVNPTCGCFDSLWEVAVNGIAVEDLVWHGRIAFLAAGNDGVRPLDAGSTPQFLAPPPAPPSFVRSLDANDTLVAAVGVPRAIHYFSRSGSLGETLTSTGDDMVDLQPAHVALVEDRIVVSSDAQFFEPQEPDEQVRGALEVRLLSGGAPPPAVGGIGRARRAAASGDHVLVADYSGGVRIYRQSSADTSLVALLTMPSGGLAYDVALDEPRARAYVAAGSGGLLIADIADPGAPTAVSVLPLSGSVRAVTVIDSGLVVTAQREGGQGRVTFADVSIPVAPSVLGSLVYFDGQDPRAIAVKDTVAFVADGVIGVLSVGFGDPALPVRFGNTSGAAARDLDLGGDLLLVATALRGLQVVDVFDPASALIRAEVAAPPIEGVARSGNLAALLLGEAGASIVDVSSPSSPQVLGPVPVPGFSRDAALVGDTLLVVAATYGLERIRLEQLRGGVPSLSVTYDEQAVAPSIRVAWPPGLTPGAVGWNLYREVSRVGSEPPAGSGARVNGSLIPISATEAADPAPVAGRVHLYRLEALLEDGGARKAAEGSIFIASTARVGEPYPNPYRPGLGSLTLPFRVLSGGGPLVLRVYDVEGRLIARTEASAPPGGGFGSIAWDGLNSRGRVPANGLYFLQLLGPGIEEGRRVVLLR